MAHIIAARIGEDTTTTGTGAYAVIGAVIGHKTFASRMSVNDWFYGFVQAVDANGNPTGAWEEGLYTYTAANTISRTTIHASSNDDAAVNWAAGTKRIYIGYTSFMARSLFAGSVASNITSTPGSGGAITYTTVPTGIVSNSTVNLARNTVYMGTLNLSGLTGVTVLASGTGDQPVVSPGAVIPTANWTLHAGNIYKATFATFTPTQVMINGSVLHASHLPVRATRWYTSDAGSPTNQIYFTPPTADIVGAKIFVRIHNSAEQERTITAYSAGVITMDSAVDASASKQFYIEGKLSMLTESNSWCYEAGVLYVWAPDGLSPANRTTIVTQEAVAINADNTTNCAINNITIMGGSRGVSGQSTTNLAVNNCSIIGSTRYAVYNGGSTGTIMDGNTVTDALRDGLDAWFGSSSVTIRNNTVNNVGMVGMPKTSHGGIHIGAESNSGTTRTNMVKNNRVNNAGYHGIQVTWNFNTTVEDNTVAGFCKGFNDGGGIYTGCPARVALNMLIQRNTVSGGITGDPTGGVGIYLDDSANDVRVTSNTVSDCDTNYLLHNSFNTTTTGNTFIADNNSVIIQVALSANDLPSGPANTRMFNNVFTDNTLRSRGSDVQSFNLQAADNMPNWMTCNNNTYNMIFGTGARFARTWTGVGAAVDRNYTDWRAFMGSDSTSVYNVIT